MADEHDSWFKDAFGFDIGESAQQLPADPADAAQNRVVMVKHVKGSKPEVTFDGGREAGFMGVGDPWMLSPGGVKYGEAAADGVLAPFRDLAAIAGAAVAPNASGGAGDAGTAGAAGGAGAGAAGSQPPPAPE